MQDTTYQFKKNWTVPKIITNRDSRKKENQIIISK